MRRTVRPSSTILALSTVPAAAVAAQVVTARVVDERPRGPLEAVDITLPGPDSGTVAQATTRADGFFHLAVRARGRYTVVVQPDGYATARRLIDVGDATEHVLPAFVLPVAAFALDPLEATAQRDPISRDVGCARASHVLGAHRMAALEQRGASVYSAVREIGGLRVFEMTVR